jgi:hypothetical protein
MFMLLVFAMPSMAQSSRLDSLQHVQQKINQQSQQIQLQYDSLYKIIAQCKTDAELLVQYEVLNKLDKKSQQLGNRMRKVEGEIQVEQARIEQVEREANLTKKHAAAQAKSPVPLKGELNGHAWVDLGLPSGTKWATYNVGTSQIHGVGTRVAWGEIATKKTFSPSAYSLNNVELPSYAGDAKYDLATAKWGEGWYTPTKEQWDELVEHCDWDYVMINGINGVIFTSKKTYNYIFLPSTGYTDDETYKLKYTTYNLAYWSCTTQRNNGAFAYMANYEQGYVTSTNRYIAHCVRAVCGTPSQVANTIQKAATTIQNVQETTKNVQNNVQEAKKTIQQTSNTIKEATETFQTLQNIFNR